MRKVYGVAGAGHGNGARLNLRFAWPSGQWGSLPIAGGLEAAYRRELEASADPVRCAPRSRSGSTRVLSPSAPPSASPLRRSSTRATPVRSSATGRCGHTSSSRSTRTRPGARGGGREEGSDESGGEGGVGRVDGGGGGSGGGGRVGSGSRGDPRLRVEDLSVVVVGWGSGGRGGKGIPEARVAESGLPVWGACGVAETRLCRAGRPGRRSLR